MSINWVMLDPSGRFVRLPGEEIVWKSPLRTSLAIKSPQAYPGNDPLSIHSNAGLLYLTNQRVVYLPAAPTPGLESFSASLLNLHDTHVVVPWFGANSWNAVLQPVPGGNIPLTHAKIELSLTFNEGGAADFHTNFERIKERLMQALEAARGSGLSGSSATGPVGSVNLDSVHLDQLPSYEASGQDALAPMLDGHIPQGPPIALASINDLPHAQSTEAFSGARSSEYEPLSDALPGYEQTQQQSIQEEFERRFPASNG